MSKKKEKLEWLIGDTKENREMYSEVSYDVEKVLAERRERIARKQPTSIALNPETIEQLKALAEIRGIPYQVLMRSYILKGLKEDLAS